MKHKDFPHLDPDGFLDKAMMITDPFGSYTGVPLDQDETPVQDADDL